jgi:hypothetical protein
LTMADDEDETFGSLRSFAGLEDEPFRRVLRARPATAGGSWLTVGHGGKRPLQCPAPGLRPGSPAPPSFAERSPSTGRGCIRQDKTRQAGFSGRGGGSKARAFAPQAAAK